MIGNINKIIAIGASTGGTEAISKLLSKMPLDCPPIVIVQHMLQNFTKKFAERLNRICDITVKEAEEDEILVNGKAVIAPGNYHMEIVKKESSYYIKLLQTDRVFYQRPAIEVLFNSVAKQAGKNAIGVLLTGMGRDGANGLLNMRKVGAYTIAQDEKSCVVFGMPKEAIKLGAAQKILDIDYIANEIMNN